MLEPRAGGSAPELFFVEDLPTRLADGDLAIDLRRGLGATPGREELTALQRTHAARWRAAFIDWLGELNRRHASLGWWAQTSTAKNLLSSPLGEQCLDLLALDRLLVQTTARRVFVAGAHPAQQQALGQRWGAVGKARWSADLGVLPRLAWQFARILALWCRGSLRAPSSPAPEIMLFTYVDGSFRDGPDAFFGSLARYAAERKQEVSICHVAFVHSRYRDVMPRLAAASGRYVALFAFLSPVDLLRSLKAALSAWWRAGRVEGPALDGVLATPLLRAALRWDLGKGGYFYNMLVYFAALRMFSSWRPRLLLYPYENKALEKCLLLAARRAVPECRVVGFQHASITPRHATLLFAEGEADITPLPDRIVTVGAVTRQFLEANGRYPAGIFRTGCALRQQGGPVLERRFANGPLRVLLALSSSRHELVSAVQLCQDAVNGGSRFALGIRPHPEFPLAVLPAPLRAWIAERAIDLTGTALQANLEWCDCVAYVSSTVALEALGRGRPVVHLVLSEALDPDPILDPVALHWTADSPAALAFALTSIAALDAQAFEHRRREGIDYVMRYLGPPTPEALDAFFPA